MPVSDRVLAGATILLPALFATLASTRLPAFASIPVQRISIIILFFAFHLLPLHIIGFLEQFGLLQRVSVRVCFVAVVGFGLSVLAVLYRRPSSSQPKVESMTSSAFVAALPSYARISTVFLVGALAVLFVDAITAYPTGWDALGYHLPLAVRWLQESSLKIPATGAWFLSMPGNGELGMMLILATGWQAGAFLLNCVWIVVMALACYSIAFKLSGRTVPSFVATLVVLSLPLLQHQAFRAYVDLYGSAAILGAVTLFLYRKDGSPESYGFLLAGLACGIALGTKQVFYVYCALFFGGAIIAMWMEERSWRRIAAVGAPLLLAGMLLPSAFWFTRALIQTGNPVYPIRIEIPGMVTLPGVSTEEITDPDYDLRYVQSRPEWLIYPWREWKRASGYLNIPYSVDAGLGGAFAAFIPIGLLYLASGTGRRGAPTIAKALLAAVIVALVIWWFGLRRMPRFGLVIWVVSCILTAPLFTYLSASGGKVFRYVVVASIAITCLLSSFVPLYSLLSRVKSHQWSRHSVYEIPAAIDSLPPGAIVLNREATFNNFALSGRQLTNRVILDLEAPPNLSAEFLKFRHVQYIVESSETESMWNIPDVNASLVWNGRMTDRRHWRIWKLQ